jgi:glyoxylase-like metal-dependent hydrolase (beta-lactamase superfamily II)
MRKALIAAALVFAIAQGHRSFAAGLRLEKVSEHCYYIRSEAGGENVAAVATEEGILIVDPPADHDRAAAVVEALKKSSSKAVRWVVYTDPSFVLTSGARYFGGRSAVFLASSQLHKLSISATAADSRDLAPSIAATAGGTPASRLDFAWFIFGGQMRLFPAGLEIRVFALRQKARTGGDVVVSVPAEKVLLVGRLFESASYPDIDTASGGNAVGWIEGLKQVVDSMPVLKSAIPQAKPYPKAEPEKTLEEGITVIQTFGEVSNFQNLKDLLEASQKLRNEISRAVRAGRSCSSFLASSRASEYRSYANLDSYACRLFEDLSAEMNRKKSAGSK